MTATKRKQLSSIESGADIPPPSSELLTAADDVCNAAGALAKLRERIRSKEHEYRNAKAAAADAQRRHDVSQGAIPLGELVAEVNATKLAFERAEAALAEAQRLLLSAQENLAELDRRHRALVAKSVRPLRTVAADQYRAIALELRAARNLYCDLGLVLFEQDFHALSIHLADLETGADLLYEPNRKVAPFVAQYETVRRALSDGRRR